MTTHVSRWVGRRSWRWLALVALSVAGCDGTLFLHLTASLGGTTPGSRGTIKLSFVNNTPYFAVFSFGLYDPLDETGTPIVGQFFADADNPDQRLERYTSSDVYTVQTGRVLSLGDREFIEYARTRSTGIDTETLAEGILFYDQLTSDPDAQSTLLYGFDGQVLQLGIDFVTGSEIIYTFEPDETQPAGVRVEVEIIPPTS
ncbi:MAG: hypothetical protein GXY55_20540 [Phycisphaerae bacterium]|nr:hypothetical protein [Phycisphaerae bacterium]